MSRDGAAYLAYLGALLPSGAAWPTDPASALMRTLAPLASALARVDARAADLVAEADPRSAVELLAEWEADAGLPDACVGPEVGLEVRRQAVVRVLTSRGGQSRAYFIGVAGVVGRTIAIEEFDPLTCEHSCDRPALGDEWLPVWRVRAGAVPVGEASCASDADTPLRWWGDKPLECMIRRFKPAHTHVLFGYGAQSTGE